MDDILSVYFYATFVSLKRQKSFNVMFLLIKSYDALIKNYHGWNFKDNVIKL